MKCKFIIGITLGDPTKNPEFDLELSFCTWALRKRYEHRQNETRIICGELLSKDVENPNLSSLSGFESHRAELAELSRQWASDKSLRCSGIGIYIQCHGVVSDTRPSVKTIARLISHFYLEHGIYFAKINLSACFSGGREGIIDPPRSAGFQLCTELSNILTAAAPPNQVAFMLNDAMLACYREKITFFADEATITEAEEGLSAHSEKVKLTSHAAPGISKKISNSLDDTTYRETHPNKSKMEHSAETIRELLSQVEYKKFLYFYAKHYSDKNHPLRSMVRYITHKIVFKYLYSKNAWEPASLYEYSDSADLIEMVSYAQLVISKKENGKGK
jgi:hypothetical protein